jgi:hypothetical protein
MSGENNPADDDGDVRTMQLSDEGRCFAQRSAVLTGFEPYDLPATGMADLYSPRPATSAELPSSTRSSAWWSEISTP